MTVLFISSRSKSFEPRIARAVVLVLVLALAEAPAMAAGPGDPVAPPVPPATVPPTPVPQGRACSTSTATTLQLAVIDTVGDRQFQCLGLSLDGDTVKAIRLETHRFPSGEVKADQAEIKIEEFPEAVTTSSRGAVLDGVPGHDAIILRGQISAPTGESALVFSYLYNGITGDYHNCRITLEHTAATGWRLVNRLDQTVAHIVIVTRQIPMVGVFGIANLEGACT